ncbi:unnamed protein product, partial [Mesorhabditis belari]|uniref:Uncharacterized protein n=1 Tax=Mesorhabditis belari TaxID=2138241 RepID=A0AAF3ESW3_9BILA
MGDTGDTRYSKLAGRTCWLIYVAMLIGCMLLLACGMLSPWFYVAPLHKHGFNRIVAGFGYPSAQITYKCMQAVFAENATSFADLPVSFVARKCGNDEKPDSSFWNDTAIRQAVEIHKADNNGIDECLWISLGSLVVASSTAIIFFLLFFMNVFACVCTVKYGRLLTAIGALFSSTFCLPAAICTFRAVFPLFKNHPLLRKIAGDLEPPYYLGIHNLMGHGRYSTFFAGFCLCFVIILGFTQAFVGVFRNHEKRKMIYDWEKNPSQYRRVSLAHKDCEQKHACNPDLHQLTRKEAN